MAALNIKCFITLFIAVSSLALFVRAADNINYLDIEAPTVFNYNSPLRQPDSLRSRPYFDFLSTLYRRDTTKSELFRPYLQRQRREAPIVPSPLKTAAAAAANAASQPDARRKRAILFRPVFVYKQQQVRKQEAARRRRRRF